MIVKIQRPLMTNGQEKPQALIYNQDRSVEAMIDYEAYEGMFELYELKIYHYAHMEGTILHIDERAPDQDW